MVVIGLGANLPSRYGSPVETLAAALAAIEGGGVQVLRRSGWYETAPVPASDQPWYVNGVAALALPSGFDAAELLHRLHAVEAEFGRVRTVANAARAVDLDLLDFDGAISSGWPALPHPRLHERAFVLRPLAELVPGWRHPVTGIGIAELLADVDPLQTTRKLLQRSDGFQG